ncbi:CvpA family protein [candidate division WOR-3 bacterium]|nr:CvpA family protein [candidate division WOR-3 bacterium]
MQVIDIVILAIIVISTLYGLIKGLVRQAFGIVAVVAGIWVAAKNFTRMAERLPIQNPTIANIVSFIILFVVASAVILIIGFIIRKVIHFASLGWIDKLVGGILGFIIGICVNWFICLLILSYTPRGEAIIGKSKFGPKVLSAGKFLKGFLPQEAREKFEKKLEELNKLSRKKGGYLFSQ